MLYRDKIRDRLLSDRQVEVQALWDAATQMAGSGVSGGGRVSAQRGRTPRERAIDAGWDEACQRSCVGFGEFTAQGKSEKGVIAR